MSHSLTLCGRSRSPRCQRRTDQATPHRSLLFRFAVDPVLVLAATSWRGEEMLARR
jgi:hypothetical protein